MTASHGARNQSENGTVEVDNRAQTGDRPAPLREHLEESYRAAGREARRIGEALRGQARLVAARQREALLSSAHDIARELDSEADRLSEQANISEMVRRAADRLGSTADTLAGKSTSELRQDAEALCRRYPVAVAAGALVAGALVSYAIKSAGRASGEAL
jgi:hypothetical protein